MSVPQSGRPRDHYLLSKRWSYIYAPFTDPLYEALVYVEGNNKPEQAIIRLWRVMRCPEGDKRNPLSLVLLNLN